MANLFSCVQVINMTGLKVDKRDKERREEDRVREGGGEGGGSRRQ